MLLVSRLLLTPLLPLCKLKLGRFLIDVNNLLAIPETFKSSKLPISLTFLSLSVLSFNRTQSFKVVEVENYCPNTVKAYAKDTQVLIS